VPENTAEI